MGKIIDRMRRRAAKVESNRRIRARLALLFQDETKGTTLPPCRDSSAVAETSPGPTPVNS